jgi:hypothetical protein
MATTKFSESSAALPPSVCKNLLSPIPFVSKVKKMEMVDGPDIGKTALIKLEFFMDPENSSSNYSQQFSIFKDGCPEEYIK